MNDFISTSKGNQLSAFVDRLERLAQEKQEISEDIKEVYKQAKAVGFDTTIIRKVIAERKKDAIYRQEQLSLFDIYWDAVHGGGVQQAAE